MFIPQEFGDPLVQQYLEGSVTRDHLSPEQVTFISYLKDLGLTPAEIKGKKILDLGAGAGEFAVLARQYQAQVVSLEPDPGMWQDMGRVFTDSYVQGEGAALPFADGSFDLVVSRSVLHIFRFGETDLSQLLGEVNRVLKPRGEFRFGPGGPQFDTEPENYQELNLLKTKREQLRLTPTEMNRYSHLTRITTLSHFQNVLSIYDHVRDCADGTLQDPQFCQQSSRQLDRILTQHPSWTEAQLSQVLRKAYLQELQKMNPQIVEVPGNPSRSLNTNYAYAMPKYA